MNCARSSSSNRSKYGTSAVPEVQSASNSVVIEPALDDQRLRSFVSEVVGPEAAQHAVIEVEAEARGRYPTDGPGTKRLDRVGTRLECIRNRLGPLVRSD